MEYSWKLRTKAVRKYTNRCRLKNILKNEYLVIVEIKREVLKKNFLKMKEIEYSEHENL